MNKPKYQIGDRLGKTNLTIRGITTLSTGLRRYFLQIADTNNTLVVDDVDIYIEEDIPPSAPGYPGSYPPDEIVGTGDRNIK